MASSRMPPAKPLELDLTVVNAKHLKNVNWKIGDLKPYAIFWVDPDRRLATKPDDSGSTRPVWNEQFTVPLALPLSESVLTLEVFHSKPSETPKPLVGSLLIHLRDLPDPQDKDQIRTYELFRPSGRPHGKIRIKLAVRERPMPPEYFFQPSGYYYGSAPPPPPPTSRSANLPPPPAPLAMARAVTMPAPAPPTTVREYRPYSVPTYAAAPPPPPPGPAQSPPAYSYAYSDAYSGYYPGYYSSAPPPPPPRPFYDRGSGYGGPSGGPSAPVDYSYTTAYEKQRSGKMGLGAGLAVGAVAGALGGLALEEGLNYEEEKIAERVESDLAARDDYIGYPADG